MYKIIEQTSDPKENYRRNTKDYPKWIRSFDKIILRHFHKPPKIRYGSIKEDYYGIDAQMFYEKPKINFQLRYRRISSKLYYDVSIRAHTADKGYCELDKIIDGVFNADYFIWLFNDKKYIIVEMKEWMKIEDFTVYKNFIPNPDGSDFLTFKIEYLLDLDVVYFQNIINKQKDLMEFL